MDQAQSNQTEIAMRSFKLKKEQIEAYFNRNHLIANTLPLSLQTNPSLNESLINQNQLTNQQVDQQLNHQLNPQIPHQLHPNLEKSKLNRSLSPNQLNSIFNPISLTNDQLDNERFKNNLNFLTHFNGSLNNVSSLNNLKSINETNQFISPLKRDDLSSKQPIQTSAFKPVARRKDSVYSMDCKLFDPNKRLTYDQQLMDLIKNKSIDLSLNEQLNDLPIQRIKSPKKSFNLIRKSPTGQMNTPYSPTRHLASEQQSTFNKNSFSPSQFHQLTSINKPQSSSINHLSNLNSLSLNSNSSLNSPFNNLSFNYNSFNNSTLNQISLNHSINSVSSLNYSKDDEDDDNSLPLDMTKNKSSTKKDNSDEDLNMKSKRIKEANISQYINKIISDNEAIIETNELKLPKRLSSRNSTSNLPSNLSQLRSKNNHLNRMNRSMSVVQPPVQLQNNFDLNRLNVDRLNHESPKLVSALRGQLEINEQRIKSIPNLQSTINLEQPNSSILTSSLYSAFQTEQNRKLSGNYLFLKQLDNLDNNASKSFFNSKTPTIKVTPPSGSSLQEESVHNLDNYSKSSIIKDLLLVNKDSFQQKTDKINEDDHKLDESTKSDQEELSCLVYVCTICNIAFRNKETLAAHQTHYCKNNNQSNKELYSEVARLTDGCKDSTDKLNKNNMSRDALGNILKKHLLDPNSNSVLPKKRKISEPTFPSSSLNNHSLFAKELSSNSLRADELDKQNSQTNETAFFSNFGLDAQSTTVARKISVLHPASRPYFINIKQPVFEHEHSIDLRQIPGLPAQLNSELFLKTEPNLHLLKSEHNNSVTNLTNLDQFKSTKTTTTSSTYTTQSSSTITQSSPIIHSSKVTDNKNSNNSSHKYIDQLKDYIIISEYLPHYDRKITVKGQLRFDVLAKTLEDQGEKAEFVQSDEEENCVNIYKINNEVKQISSMPIFMDKSECGSLTNVSTNVIDLTDGSNSKSKETSFDENEDNHKKDEDKLNKENKSIDNKIDKIKQLDKPYKPITSETSSIATKRPADLFNCLRKKPSQLTCSNLVSPETPRSEKTFVQCYLDGQLYTYLAPKKSTRVTFCCIYRPQPCCWLIDEPKLSMYSNWQIFPPYEKILNEHKAPVLMKCYDSRQWKHRLYCYTSKFTIKLEVKMKSEKIDSERKKESISNEKSDEILNEDNGIDKNSDKDKKSLTDEYLERLRQLDDRNGCLMIPTFNWMMKKLKQDRINIKIKLKEFKKKFCEESSDLTERLLKRRQRKISRKISDEYSINQSEIRQVNRKQSSTVNQPKRIYIFEGGFKSNEDYVYIRGKGKGKYVCVECGIRCKKPSMLRKHIRTHSDLRPYSCNYCSFAFKTKGNLTKHMKSKAHHKKCAELGISPVPTSIDTHTQIDTKALAIQEAIERASNQPCLNEDFNNMEDDDVDYDSDDQLNLLDDFDDDIDDDQLDLKYGIDEDDDLEDEEDEEYLRRLNYGDQHLHITGLRIISNNFVLNKNDPFIGLDTSNNYLGVNIGCLTNFKRLSAFNDIILPNSVQMNKEGNDRFNKFSIIQDAFNSIKGSKMNNHHSFSTSSTTNLNFLKDNSDKIEKNVTSSNDLKSNESSTMLCQSATDRLLFNQTDSTSLQDVVKSTDNLVINKTNDSGKNSCSSFNILDNNNNLVILNRTRLTDEPMQSLNAIRHKHSLISGVNGNTKSHSLASIPECLEEESRKEEEQLNSSEIDKNNDRIEDKIFESLDNRSLELKRKNEKLNECEDSQNKRLKNESEINRDKVKKDEDELTKSMNNVSNRTDKMDCEKMNFDKFDSDKLSSDKAMSTSLETSTKLIKNVSNKMTDSIALNEQTNKSTEQTKLDETRLDECTLMELDKSKSNEYISSNTLTTGKKDVIDLNSTNKLISTTTTNYLNHYHKTVTAVGGVTNTEQLIESNEFKELTKSNKPTTDLNELNKSSNSRPMLQLINLSQLSKDAIPKYNLDYRPTDQNRSKSLPPQALKLVNHQLNESRSTSVNSMKISEIDEQEVAHSLLSLSRNYATNDAKSNKNEQQKKHSLNIDQITLPIKRKISQEFGFVPYHHGNYSYIDDLNTRSQSPAKSPLTTYSDEEVSRAFKRVNIKNEKNWSTDDLKLNEKLTDRIKYEIHRKFSERSNVDKLISDLETNDDKIGSIQKANKLSEKLAEIKRKGLENPIDLTKRIDEKEDIQKLLQKVESKTKNEEEIDHNKLISIHIQNTIDLNERILNQDTFSTTATATKQPIDHCRTNICNICNKTFTEESGLKLHEKIHIFERPFRCSICSVSFRSSGHLQKHYRSVSHQNKLNMNSTFGQPSPTNPRPFKCSFCKISFRIFGHLSKHLRSKIHIGKLEGLGKLPPGLYSLMERNKIQLNDLDTTDCDTNLQSLCNLAKKLQSNGDLPLTSNLASENYSTTSQSSFVCSSAYCESSNEDSNLSCSRSIEEKQIVFPSLNYLNENSLPPAVQFTPDLLYSKLATTTSNSQILVTNSLTNPLNNPISLFNSTAALQMPLDSNHKPISLIPSHLIDNFAIYSSSHYIPQQQFYDQAACKHPHHLYPNFKTNFDILPHGHPLPKTSMLPKSISPEINILEDSNDSTKSSFKLEEDASKKIENLDIKKETKIITSSPSPPIPSISPRPKTSSPNFSSIQLNSNTCSICNQVFKSAKFLQVHLYVNHKKSNENSKDENKKEEKSKIDKTEVECKEQNECKICDKIFDNKEQFRTHVLIHSIARPFICDKCDAGFSTKDFLNSHIESHKS